MKPTMITHYNDVTNTTDPMAIDWNNIEFLTATVSDGTMTIQRATNIPQYGGLTVVVAYLHNFMRVIQSFGGQHVLDCLDQGQLWDIAMHLARGGAIPYNCQMERTNETTCVHHKSPQLWQGTTCTRDCTISKKIQSNKLHLWCASLSCLFN